MIKVSHRPVRPCWDSSVWCRRGLNLRSCLQESNGSLRSATKLKFYHEKFLHENHIIKDCIHLFVCWSLIYENDKVIHIFILFYETNFQQNHCLVMCLPFSKKLHLSFLVQSHHLRIVITHINHELDQIVGLQ
jgi:hypothetical protein